VLIVNHSTVAGNMALAEGGGIASVGGALLARNTILAGNTVSGGSGPDLNGVLTSLGHNLIGDTAGASGFVASDLLNIDALLGPLQDNGGPTQTMALLPGSPAIDAGDNTDAPAYDQRGPGYPRIVNGKIDIGAFEVQPGGAAQLQPRAPAPVLSHTAFAVTVPAPDAYGHPANGYVGTVMLRSSDPVLGVMLPAASPFTTRTATPSLAGMVQTALGTAEAVDVVFGRQHGWEPESANTSSWFRDKELSTIGEDWLANGIADWFGRRT
jgi:hypothetical protein